MTKRLKVLIYFLCCFLLWVDRTPAIAKEKATVLRIIDGDTFLVLLNGKREKIRLLGIDTPEKYWSRKLKKEARRCGVREGRISRLGIRATKYAKGLIHKGDQIYLEIRGRGHYGRILAFVYLKDGSCYNERVIGDGYACVYKYRGRKSRQLSWDEFFKLIRLLNDAKAHKRGLWNKDFKLMECLCD